MAGHTPLLSQALSWLYQGPACCAGHHMLNADEANAEPQPAPSAYEALRSQFNAAVAHIYQQQGFTPAQLADEPVKGLINGIYKEFKEAISTGITLGGGMASQALQKLQTDVYVFSGMKTYAQLREAANLMVQPGVNGGPATLKPYAQFEREALDIHQAYNVHHLRTEYHYAATTAQNAARWAKYEAQKERYHLKYMTDNGPNVRPSHKALEGIVLPVDDPFWNQYAPKNGWNCHCYLEQVRIGEEPVSNSEEATKLGEAATTRLAKDGSNAEAMFRYNPGKQGVIFPPRHPYVRTKCGSNLSSAEDNKCAAKKVVERMAKDDVLKV
ncbi:MAG TPA: phage minor head protein, partial [Phnomibacter sp.]|nr:phage minor head protein [Phnomibacter sp.]